jgi:hypothetical protein
MYLKQSKQYHVCLSQLEYFFIILLDVDDLIGSMTLEEAETNLKFTLEMDFLQLDLEEKRD